MNLKPAFLAAALLLSSAAVVSAADPSDVSGTYTWSMGGGGGGGQGGTTTLVLKQEGTKLTGTISGRGGDTPIEDGTVEGGAIKFKVTRDWNGTKMVTEYSGSVSGSDLKLTQTTTREIEAKKSA